MFTKTIVGRVLAYVPAVALTVVISIDLVTAEVSTLMSVAVGLGLAAAFLRLTTDLLTAPRTTVHTCREPGCRFQVRITDASPADSRRWQETAVHSAHAPTT